MAQTILARIGQLMRANINAPIDQGEDPEPMLDQLIRDFSTNIAEAEQASSPASKSASGVRRRWPAAWRRLRARRSTSSSRRSPTPGPRPGSRRGWPSCELEPSGGTRDARPSS